MNQDITSRQNKNIKLVRSLRLRKERKSTGLFLVEGIWHIGEAVAAEAPIEFLLVCPPLLKDDYSQTLLQKAGSKGIPIFTTSTEIFASLAEKENPAGMIGVLRQTPATLADLSPQNFHWGAAVVAPQDPGNLGAILRTVNAAGASGLIVLNQGVDIYHPTAVRASMGAIFWHPVVNTTFQHFHSWVQQNGYSLYGTSAKGEKFYNQITYQFPAILLMGSEREGLSADQAEACDELVKLPMHGNVSSLNLSVAAGIMLYHLSASRN